MISVILPALVEEPATIETLAILVEGVAEGVLRDCVLVSAKPSIMFEGYADAAGCSFMVENGPNDALVKKGATQVRSDWSLVITPGLVPSGDWLTALGDWISDKPKPTDAAFIPFYSRKGWSARLNALAVNTYPYVVGKPHPLQGFIVSTSLLRQGAMPRLAMRRLDARMMDRRISA
jgi:hypothetical protein